MTLWRPSLGGLVVQIDEMWRVGLAVLLTACFNPSFAPCVIRCGSGCPTDWTCGGDGFCHAAEGETACVAPGMPDAPPADAGDPDAELPGDATPVLPDGGCTTELLVNGAFDESTGTDSMKSVPGWSAAARWVLHDTQATAPESSHTPSYFARLGSDFDQITTVCQTLTIPADTLDLALSGFHWVTTEETTTTVKFDSGRIELRRTTSTDTPLTLTNLNKESAWTSFARTIVPAPAGETFDLCLVSDNDSDLVTSFRFDTLSLKAAHCH